MAAVAIGGGVGAQLGDGTPFCRMSLSALSGSPFILNLKEEIL